MLRSVFGKVVHDQWRMVLGWAAFAGIWPAMYVALYPSIGALGEMQAMLEQMPPAVREFFASASLDLSSPEGFLNMELFTFVAPLLILAYAVVVASGATAGEEEGGTMDLLLANPVPRWRIVVEKSVAFMIGTVVIGIGMWVGAVAGAAVMDVELDAWLVGQAIASAVLLGYALGGLALAIGALTGRRWLAAGVSLMVAIAGFFLNGLGALVDWLQPWRPLSPFYHYIANDPLSNGLDPGHALVLVAWAVIGGPASVAEPARGRPDGPAQPAASVASTDSSTLPLRAIEIGQFSLASSASVRKVAASMPGTSPTTAMWLRVTFQPPLPLSNVTSARTLSFVAGVPFLARRDEKAIEKQLAWAAARSSSGEVLPSWALVREAHDTGIRAKAPLDT